VSVMNSEVYKAFRAANVPDELALDAARSVADYEDRFNKIETDLAVLKWLVGFTFAGVLSLVLKSFA